MRCEWVWCRLLFGFGAVRGGAGWKMGFGGREITRGGDGGRVCMGWSRGWMGIGKAGEGWRYECLVGMGWICWVGGVVFSLP